MSKTSVMRAALCLRRALCGALIGQAVSACFLTFASPAYGQDDSIRPGGLKEDSTTVLFEDVYGRFPAGVMPSLSIMRFEAKYEGNLLIPELKTTDGMVDVSLGDRKSYELTGRFQNSAQTGSLSSQNYNLAFYSRAVDGWQFGGAVNYNRTPSPSYTDGYSAGLSLLHLTGGIVKFSESRMEQYFYFSYLLPDRGQLVVSFSPDYTYWKSGTTKSSNVGTPFSLSYGLPDAFTLTADASFIEYRNNYPITLPNGMQTLEYRNSEFKAGAGINRLFSDKTLLNFNADYISLGHKEPYFDGMTAVYVSGPAEDQTFALLSLELDNLFLNTPISVYDLRRSYYLGHYLHEGEATNSVTATYATQDVRLPETLIRPLVSSGYNRFGVEDKFSFGLLGVLEANAEGALLQHSGRYGSIGLTLHSLSFSGPELSDFDYFFGMINRPGDYTATLAFSSSNLDYSPSTGVSAGVRYGIIRNLDAALNYSYQKYNTFAGQSGNTWGIQLRGNLLGFMRAEGSADWGNMDYSGGFVSRTKSVQYNLGIRTFF